MPTQRIIVLANSIKKHARCVAGRVIDNGVATSEWIRPVSGATEGELEPQHMRIADGRPLSILDIMDVPLAHCTRDAVHPEDWIVDTGVKWTRVGKCDAKTLASLEDKPKNLWLESSSHSDRVTAGFLQNQPKHQSLYFIRPDDLRVHLSYTHNRFKNKNQKKSRAKFSYLNQEYEMSLTDPEFTDKYCTKYPELGAPDTIVRPPYKDKCLVCLSLTPVFNGYHYKVVATILELP